MPGEAHLGVALAPVLLVLAAALLLPRIPVENRLVRAGGALLCAVLMLRYIAWRALETLPADPADPASWLAWVFFLLELANIGAGLILMHVVSRTGNRSAEADAHPPEHFPDGPPRIDMLIPTYNEGADILRRTIIGAMSQDYPNFRVWVLDDTRRDWMRDLATSLGAGYITRPDNAHGKAGNMNAGIAKLLALPDPPEVVAVLDADFIATPRFLSRAAALLHDPKVGVVQTPQIFFNPDPIQMNLGNSRILPDEQRFFFDVILASKDAHGTAFSCGTSALIRIEALQEIGGFPTESVTEDMLLSLKLSCAGWSTVYLHEPLTSGLAPEGLPEYITQRGRWCLGAMQIIRSRWGPFSRGHVPWRLRLHTLDSFLFWGAGPLLRLFCLVCPIIYWWTGMAIMQAELPDLIWHLGPFWLVLVIYLGWVSRGTNIPVLTDAMALIMAYDSVRATAVGLFGSRDQKFKVTDKGTRRDGVVIHWRLLRWFMALAALTMGGIAWSALGGAAGGTTPGIDAVNLFWSLYNIVSLGAAGLLCIEQPRRRREERFEVDEPVELRCGGVLRSGRMRDVSLLGCRVEVAGGFPAPAAGPIEVRIAGAGAIPARIVRMATTSSGAPVLHMALEPSDAQKAVLLRRIFAGGCLQPVHDLSPMVFARVLLRRAFG